MLTNPDGAELLLPTPVGEVFVRSPGLRLDIQAQPPVAIADLAFTARPFVVPALGELEEALREAGLEDHVEFRLDDARVAGEGLRGRRLTVPGSPLPHLMLDVPVPAAEEEEAEDYGLLAMKVEGGLVQFHLPVSTSDGPAIRSFSILPGATRSRFLIPLNSAPAAREADLAAPVGFSLEGGIGAIVRILKFRIIRRLLGAAAEVVVAYLAECVESRLKREGLKWLRPGFPAVAPGDGAWGTGGRALLLVHGIFSSVEGAFESLLSDHDGLYSYLQGAYGGRIVGWDHWTVAKTPLENATELLAALPDGITLDILCHSRGGVVTRALLEHPDVVDTLAAKGIVVDNVVFVASVNQGSPLAEKGNWDRLLNVFTALASLPGLAPGMAIPLKLIAEVFKLLAHGILGLPSLEALAPGSPFIRALNGVACSPVRQYCYVRANFDRSRSLVLRGADLGVDFLFRNAPNDLVVPFEGAGTFDAEVRNRFPLLQGPCFGSASDGQGAVWHTNYFVQPEVRNLLRQELA